MGIPTSPSVDYLSQMRSKLSQTLWGLASSWPPAFRYLIYSVTEGVQTKQMGIPRSPSVVLPIPSAINFIPNTLGAGIKLAPAFRYLILIYSVMEGVQTKQMGIPTSPSVVLPIPNAIKVIPNTLGARVKLAPSI